MQTAWCAVGRGKPTEGIRLREDVPIANKLQPGEVLVRVEAAALNPVGYKLLALLPNSVAGRPSVAEYDFAGTIHDANDTTEFKVGDPVFGWVPPLLSMKTKQGALCTFVAVPSTQIARRPPTLTAIEASGMALVGLTAWQALFDIAKLEPGQSIFINGGSSSVGSMAIQIAKAHRCRVSTSCSGTNVELVKSLGADEVLDYTQKPLHTHFIDSPPTPKFHVIFDSIGNSLDLYTSSPVYLAPGGIYVSTGWNVNSGLTLINEYIQSIFRPTWLGGTPRKFKQFLVWNDKSSLDKLADLASQGKLKPLVDSVYPFADALNAYQRILSQRAKGKVVVTAQ